LDFSVADTFDQVIRAMIADFTAHGYDSAERLAYWQRRLREAAERTLTPSDKMTRMLKSGLQAVYRKQKEQYGVLQLHPGIGRFQVDRLGPQMKQELDRRIMASADLIKLNREEAIEKALRRASGWATSIPVGGSKQVDKREETENIRKSIVGLKFVERRVIIDQSHKLTSAINNIVAQGTGALAVVWNSHFKQANYNFREDHKERHGKFYAIRGNWAFENGLMRKGPAGYYDEITSFGEEVFCRCFGTYIYSLRKLPEEMLTAKGKSELARLAKERA
jgi:hypothetical protein